MAIVNSNKYGDLVIIIAARSDPLSNNEKLAQKF
jgi:hypothetical protein